MPTVRKRPAGSGGSMSRKKAAPAATASTQPVEVDCKAENVATMIEEEEEDENYMSDSEEGLYGESAGPPVGLFEWS
eukprot:6201119-Lingulodinium_polyedra.AAC.2